MKTRFNIFQRLLSAALALVLVVGLTPGSAVSAATTYSETPLAQSATVVDPSTMTNYETMMGTDADGNRYAGRVWVDKSVFADGDTMHLSSADTGTTVVLDDGESFMIAFSALGSSTSVSTEAYVASSLDVVVVLDNSMSMSNTPGSSGNGGPNFGNGSSTTRMSRVISEAASLIDDLVAISGTRLAIVTYNTEAREVLPLNEYLEVDLTLSDTASGTGGNNNRSGGYVRATGVVNSTTTTSGVSNGYQSGTNQQAGIDLAGDILTANADTSRIPVIIVLTDGVADTADNADWQDPGSSYKHPAANTVTAGAAASTLLNAAYNRARIEAAYGGTTAHIYTIGVDIDTTAAQITMNPQAVLKDTATGTAGEVYTVLNDWYAEAEEAVSTRDDYGYSWTLNQLSNTNVTKEVLWKNLHYNYYTYTDENGDEATGYRYYEEGSTELSGTFEQILEELQTLSTPVFNPISGSTTNSGTDSPLIYVDYLGAYMEVKDIRYVQLFGKNYAVTFDAATGIGTFDETVTGINPTTGETYNASEHIHMTVSEDTQVLPGATIQKLEIEISQEIMPILLEKVDVTLEDDGTETIVFDAYEYDPLRVFYTVGLSGDILGENGHVDLSRVDTALVDINDTTGEVKFYANLYTGENINAVDSTVANGNAHVGFKANSENRYYFHQNSYAVFWEVYDEDGDPIVPIENEYGIFYSEAMNDYTYEYLDAAHIFKWENGALVEIPQADDHTVYTYLEFYAQNESGEGELKYILAESPWADLRESLTAVLLTGETAESGEAYFEYVVDDSTIFTIDELKTYIESNYAPGFDLTQIRARMAIGSLRTVRLHNMYQLKEDANGDSTNYTGTAEVAYAPTYNKDAAAHYGNDIVIYLGNNGVLTVQEDTGIALTKQIAAGETISDVSAYTFTLTIDSSVSVDADDLVIKNAQDTDIAFDYANNVITLSIAAGQTAYITGIPGGTGVEIAESINGDYHLESITGGSVSGSTTTVTVPNLTDVISGAAAEQFVSVAFTNAPNKYGDLAIVKDVDHDLSVAPDILTEKAFTFTVNVGTALKGKTYKTDYAAPQNEVTVGDDGTFAVTIKDNESITVLGLPEGTAYTVTETHIPDGFALSSTVISDTAAVLTEGVIDAGGEDTVHVVNAYSYDPAQVSFKVSGSKTLTGTSYAAEDFVFQILKYNGTEFVAMTDNRDTVNFGDWDVSKGSTISEGYEISFTDTLSKLGTYYYRIVEEAGSTEGMTYDADVGRFRVTVTDADMNGTPEVTVEKYDISALTWSAVSPNEGTYAISQDFENRYDTATTFVDIPVEKTLVNNTGVPYGYENFFFTLVQVDADGNEIAGGETQTKAATADGKLVFQVLLDHTDNFYYQITENDGGVKGMDYDKTVYTAKVAVTNDNSVLHAALEIENTEDDIARFENTYDLGSVKYVPSALKTLEGTAPADLAFTFNLYQTGSDFQIADESIYLDSTTVSLRSGSKDILFAEQTYTAVGTYYYSIKEVNTGADGVTYDTVHYHITVTVTANEAEGKLEVSETVNKIGVNAATESKAFVNKYSPASTQIQITGQKKLDGRVMNVGEFAFALYDSNGDQIGEVVKNHSTGSFSFPAITYTEADVYYYTVKEVDTGLGGVTYEKDAFEVEVTVTDIGGELSAAVTNYTPPLVITNTYKAEDASVTFSGTKTLIGGGLEEGTYTFALYETDSSFSTDGLTAKTTTNEESGSFSFDKINYSAADTHYYVIHEIAGSDSHMLYDDTVYRYRVVVTDDGAGKLWAEVTNYTTDTKVRDVDVNAAVSFTNVPYDEIVNKTVAQQIEPEGYVDGEKVQVGDQLIYTISYTNYTGEITDVTILDHIPEGTRFVSANDAGVYNNGYVIWQFAAVAPNDTVKVSFTVEVEGDNTIIPNEAVVRDSSNTYHTNEVVNYTHDEVAVKDVFLSSDTDTPINGEKVQVGDELYYAISYTNTTSSALQVEITDQIPAYTTYVEGSADGASFDGSTLKWVLEVSAWETVTVSFKVTVDAPNVMIPNKAIVWDGVNGHTTNEVYNHTFEETVQKDVVQETAPAISIDGKKVSVGDVLEYTITYANTTGKAVNVTLTDKIPAYTEYLADTATKNGVYNADNNAIDWTLSLAPWEVTEVSFNVEVTQVDGEIVNKATAFDGSNTYDSNEVTNHSYEEPGSKDVYYPSAPNISIDGRKVNVGDVIEYKISYVNHTGKDAQVRITDNIPAHTTLVSGSAGTGTLSGSTLTWVVDVAKGGVAEVTFQVKVNDADVQIINGATIVENNDYSFDTNTVINHTYEELGNKEVFNAEAPTVSIDGKAAAVGDELIYKITYTNHTGKDATVTITDKIPSYTEYVDGTAVGATFDGETLTWVQTVPKDGKAEVSFKVKVVGGGTTVSNQAVILESGNQYGTNTVTTSIPGKAVDKTTATLGETLTYTIRYVNATGAAADVTVTDKLDGNLVYVDGTAKGAVYADGTLTWVIKNVPAGEAVEVTFQAKIKAAAGITAVSNQATVAVNDYQVQTNPVTTNVTAPALSMTKTQAVGNGAAGNTNLAVAYGDTVTYYIQVSNTGTGKALGVKITDQIPAGLSYKADSVSAGGTVENGVVTWQLAELAPGATVTVYFQVTVPGVAVDTQWKNVASVVYENDPNGPNAPTSSNQVVITEEGPENVYQTGDSTNLPLLFSMMVLSSAAMAALLITTRKKEQTA